MKVENSAGRHHARGHTPSIAFRHLPPNSARFGYTTERGTLCLRAAVHRHGQRPSKDLGTDHTPCIAFRHLPPRKDVVNQCLEFVLGVMYKIYNGLVQCPNIKTKLVPPPAQITQCRQRGSKTEPGIAKPVALVHHSNRIGEHSTIFSRYFTERLLQIW